MTKSEESQEAIDIAHDLQKYIESKHDKLNYKIAAAFLAKTVEYYKRLNVPLEELKYQIDIGYVMFGLTTDQLEKFGKLMGEIESIKE